MNKIYYFDTSAYWKYYRGQNEAGFHTLRQLVASQKKPIWLSLFTMLEFHSRTEKAIRQGQIKRRKRSKLLKGIRGDIGKSRSFIIVSLPKGVYQEAERMILTYHYNFGTMDAIHLAIVNLLKQTTPNIIMITSDGGIINACRDANIDTFDPEKDRFH